MQTHTKFVLKKSFTTNFPKRRRNKFPNLTIRRFNVVVDNIYLEIILADTGMKQKKGHFGILVHVNPVSTTYQSLYRCQNHITRPSLSIGMFYRYVSSPIRARKIFSNTFAN